MEIREEKSTGIRTSLDSLAKTNENLLKLLDSGKKKEGKKYKLPRKIRSSYKKKIKQGKVLILRLSETGNITMQWTKIKDNLVYLKENETYHSATAEYVGKFEGKYPCFILPEWSLVPLKFSDLRKWAREGKAEAISQKTVIAALKQAQIGQLKSKLKGNAIIWIILGGIAALYLVGKMMGAV